MTCEEFQRRFGRYIDILSVLLFLGVLGSFLTLLAVLSK